MFFITVRNELEMTC